MSDEQVTNEQATNEQVVTTLCLNDLTMEITSHV